MSQSHLTKGVPRGSNLQATPGALLTFKNSTQGFDPRVVFTVQLFIHFFGDSVKKLRGRGDDDCTTF